LLRARRCTHEKLASPPIATVDYLVLSGFYGVSRLGFIAYDNPFISALVERWRPETHTFHTTQGECTITLQDVAVQLDYRV